MKISKILPTGLENCEATKAGKKEKVSGISFECALEEAKNSHPGDKSVSSALKPEMVNATLPVIPVQPGNNISDVVMNAENTIDSIEKFGELLSLPDTSPDRLESIVKDMNAGVQKLEKMAALLPADSSLKTILDQISALAAKEVAKFERGDYTG